MLEWFSDSDCDVWDGVPHEKPIDAFELPYTGAIVRMDATGKASVILAEDDLVTFVERPNEPEPIRMKSVDDLRREGRKIVSGHVPKKTAAKVISLIAPMRDYAAWHLPSETLEDRLAAQYGSLDGELGLLLRAYYDVDDERTKVAVCKPTVADSGYGWTVSHWNGDSSRFEGVSEFYPFGCENVLAVAGSRRVNEAAALVVTALGASGIVRRHIEPLAKRTSP